MWRCWGWNKNPVWRNLSGDESLRLPCAKKNKTNPQTSRVVRWERSEGSSGHMPGRLSSPAPRRWAAGGSAGSRDECVAELWCWYSGRDATHGRDSSKQCPAEVSTPRYGLAFPVPLFCEFNANVFAIFRGLKVLYAFQRRFCSAGAGGKCVGGSDWRCLLCRLLLCYF